MRRRDMDLVSKGSRLISRATALKGKQRDLRELITRDSI